MPFIKVDLPETVGAHDGRQRTLRDIAVEMMDRGMLA